jgi:hypothetical protein
MRCCTSQKTTGEKALTLIAIEQESMQSLVGDIYSWHVIIVTCNNIIDLNQRLVGPGLHIAKAG